MSLRELDRVQVVVNDRKAATARFATLLDAALVREDRVRTLGCRRSVLALGTSEVELLEPDGTGVVADTGPGLFSAGFGVEDLDAFASDLDKRGIAYEREGEQLFVTPAALGNLGLRVVATPIARRERVGLIERLYESTLLVPDAEAATSLFAEHFGLDAAAFVPIRSDQYGYAGALTLFRPGHLDRVEIIHPYDETKTMGRYFANRGPTLYMAYAETDQSSEIRERARAHAPRDWTGPDGDATPDNMFLHPKALGGMMLGISRTTYAWTWSGSPERVLPA